MLDKVKSIATSFGEFVDSAVGEIVDSFTSDSGPPVRLVVAVNAVDKMGPGDWSTVTNCPSKAQEDNIDRRCSDIVRKLANQTGLAKKQIAYYSALRRYRLYELLTCMIRACPRGWVFPVNPKPWIELAAPNAQAAYKEMVSQQQSNSRTVPEDPYEKMLQEISKKVSKKEYQEFKKKYDAARAIPPKIAVFGQAGVGKTTTINALFNAGFKVGHTVPVTLKDQTYEVNLKEFGLESGGTLEIVDLPGYGVSKKDDETYYPIYRAVLPKTDVILLIMQADERSMAEDQLMINNILTWLKEIEFSAK